MFEEDVSGDQTPMSPGYAPTSPAQSNSDQPEVEMDSPEPVRSRLRPIRPAQNEMTDSPEISQSRRAPKEPRIGGNDSDNMLNLIGELENEIANEREVHNNDSAYLMNVCTADVSEVFSPPRVAKMAERVGLAGGKSMDLQNGWDFSKFSDRRKALHMLRTDCC